MEVLNKKIQQKKESTNTQKNSFSWDKYSTERRDGTVVSFNFDKIQKAILSAFCSQRQEKGSFPSPESQQDTKKVLEKVLESLQDRRKGGGTFHIEEIQDLIEISLMRLEHFETAKCFVLYRCEQANQREKTPEEVRRDNFTKNMTMVKDNGEEVPLDVDFIQELIQVACAGFEKEISKEEFFQEIFSNLYKGVPQKDITKSMVMVARSYIERDPAWSKVAARILNFDLYKEVLNTSLLVVENSEDIHQAKFKDFIYLGVDESLLHAELKNFDLDKLSKELVFSRDQDINYLGLQTLYDRYFVHLKQGRRIELLQYFWMRVAMGLVINEINREEYAIKFYHILSSFQFISSTPTLFNSGTPHSQMSSCYLTTLQDDLFEIFKGIQDDALLSKFAGGLGNDWTNVRSLGSHIKGTNGESQGIIPFLKVANDTAVAVNQGGRRKGAMCAYLETWHLDIEEFLELRKNTGDDRRRTHDMNTANWVPDLFMRRIEADADWTLFSPNDVPNLHDSYGKSFEEKYTLYEKRAELGEITHYKKIPAKKLWRKMLGMLFETGHPWITFKDPSNVRSPQQHQGIVHSSNLCTEILLNTSKDEVAVCNLGSVNLALHTTKDGIDIDKLKETITIAMRMLDNVIDLNYYPVPEARNSNLRHRPVGLGLMGFQDSLYIQNIPYASEQAVEFADKSMEIFSYYSILCSSLLAKERGRYPSYEGSFWSKGILPIDSLSILEEQRGESLSIDKKASLDWNPVRESIKAYGMRNSNCMAIAPTATISNIVGVTQSIEPTYKNLFVKSNLSGEFTIVNKYLVYKLKELGIWNQKMVDDLKYFDGELDQITEIPQEVKDVFSTSFSIDPKWLIACAARRQKWIDMGQSLNLYIGEASGKKLNDMYFYAWKTGLKTTYYLRSLGATSVEKSTTQGTQGLRAVNSVSADETAKQQCSIENGEECEACQ